MTMAELLKGRSPLRCSCGTELFVEPTTTDDGETGRFVPCKCGTDEPVFVPQGSIIDSIGGVSPEHVWGPPEQASTRGGEEVDI